MSSLYKPSNRCHLNSVLLLIVGLGILVLHQHLSIDVKNFFTPFFLCIISPQCTRGTLFSNEIFVNLWKLTFRFNSINIYAVGLVTIKTCTPLKPVLIHAQFANLGSVETVSCSLVTFAQGFLAFT